jgi:1-acyl-sn-glycerol-3-phosphate acyltransferase
MHASYHGLHNVPERGPLLVVTNHMSYADPPLIFVAMWRPGMVVLAADKYRHTPIFSNVIETAGGVWIHRGGGDRAALKAAIGALNDNKILGMAPEGTRSKITHALQAGKSGAAFIAAKTGVPILPVGLTGTENVFSDLKRLRRPVISFTAGPTFTLPSLDSRSDKAAALDEHTHEIMCRIAALLPEKYHGLYANDPRIAEIRAETSVRPAGFGS